MGIEVKECNTEVKKVRTFPCLLKGYITGDYYYALDNADAFNMTRGGAAVGTFSSVTQYLDVDCLTLSLKK